MIFLIIYVAVALILYPVVVRYFHKEGIETGGGFSPTVTKYRGNWRFAFMMSVLVVAVWGIIVVFAVIFIVLEQIGKWIKRGDPA